VRIYPSEEMMKPEPDTAPEVVCPKILVVVTGVRMPTTWSQAMV
jgi:hypothetical protein